MRHNPADPTWPDRDRFVLSAGHASMLLYACLHLSGYDADASTTSSSSASSARTRRATRRTSRRRASRRPPARSARASRTASGWRWPRSSCARSSAPRSATTTSSAICSDGDLMEGVASEAASLAGHLRLGRLVYLYDDNEITIDGPTEPRVLDRGRAEALPGLRLAHARGRGRQRPRGDRGGDPRRDRRGGAPDADQPADGDRLRLAARRHAQRALATRCPTSRCARRRRRSAGIPDAQFLVPDEVYAHWREPARERGAAAAGRVAGALRRVGGRERGARRGVARRVGRAAARRASREALPVFDAGRTARLDAQGRRATSCRRSARSCRR